MGWTSTALKGAWPCSHNSWEGMREKQHLKWPSFSSGAGGGWHRWKDSAQEAFSLQGELRTVEGVETGSWQQTHKTASPGRARPRLRGDRPRQCPPSLPLLGLGAQSHVTHHTEQLTGAVRELYNAATILTADHSLVMGKWG